jgi:hypothetical protein
MDLTKRTLHNTDVVDAIKALILASESCTMDWVKAAAAS